MRVVFEELEFQSLVGRVDALIARGPSDAMR